MTGILSGMIGSMKGATAPKTAPTSLSAIPTTTNVSISFTSPSDDGGSAITNYEYSFNNSTWTALSPADVISPITISSLTPNTAYSIYLRAVNIIGSGPGSSVLSFTTAKVAPSSVEYLVVAGGGGGSGGTAGGGGAGGMRTGTLSITGATPYTVTVGGGGSGGNVGTNGQSSVFASITSTGGGRGATSNPSTAASSGGSGGGGARYDGGGYSSGSGGSGVGGNGSWYGAGAGTANRGGGGGGGWLYSGGVGGAGGSGIVIIAYPTSFTAAVATTGSPSYSSTSRSGYHVYTFTGSGSITF